MAEDRGMRPSLFEHAPKILVLLFVIANACIFLIDHMDSEGDPKATSTVCVETKESRLC